MIESGREFIPALVTAILHSLWLATLFTGLFVAARPLIKSTVREYLGAFACLLASTASFPAVFLVTLLGNSAGGGGGIGAELGAWPQGVAAAWLLGAGLSGARFVGGWTWLLLVIARSKAPPHELGRVFESVRESLAVNRARLRVSANIDTPMATGLWRPTVLLPVSMLSGVPEDVLRVAVVHELAHIRRWDHLAVIVQAVGETILFYHPAFRWLSAETRRLREFRCDEDAVDEVGSRRLYAHALLTIAEFKSTGLLPVVPMNGGELMTRVQRLYREDTRSSSLPGVVFVVLVAVLGVGGISATMFGDRAEAGPAAPVTEQLSIRWLPSTITQWREVISEAARRHQVPADFLALVMLIESRGQADAKSRSGAQGLMQIMPETALKIAEWRGLKDFTLEQLSEPSLNVDFGAWYLRQQIVRNGGSPNTETMLLAVSAYNAGPDAVDVFLEGSGRLPVETERYRETFSKLWAERKLDVSSVLPSP